ncbi:MAG: trimeric autotransporter adhesin [Candidatus Parcubacteria bacterium]|jgi:peptidoglycan hydrolase-like protein with peptidoglycan-binding domain
MKYIQLTVIAIVLTLFIPVTSYGATYIFKKNLSVGATGADVIALQDFLIAHKYHIPAIESGSGAKGYFGSQTKAAVMAYQTANSLPSTGYVGPLTIAKIHSSNNTDTDKTGPLTIISPNGGERWEIGVPHVIHWNAPQYIRATYVDIAILANYNCTGTKVCPAIAYTPQVIAMYVPANQYAYSWNTRDIFENYHGYACTASLDSKCTPPTSTIRPGEYTIQICEAGTNICDTTDKIIEIVAAQTPQTITVTSPNGNEIWPAKSAHLITWIAATGTTAIDLYLQNDSQPCPPRPLGSSISYQCRSSVQIVLDKNIPVTAKYDWIVGTDEKNNSIPPGEYLVRICKTKTTDDCDTSDSVFTIK